MVTTGGLYVIKLKCHFPPKALGWGNSLLSCQLRKFYPRKRRWGPGSCLPNQEMWINWLGAEKKRLRQPRREVGESKTQPYMWLNLGSAGQFSLQKSCAGWAFLFVVGRFGKLGGRGNPRVSAVVKERKPKGINRGSRLWNVKAHLGHGNACSQSLCEFPVSCRKPNHSFLCNLWL